MSQAPVESNGDDGTTRSEESQSVPEDVKTAADLEPSPEGAPVEIEEELSPEGTSEDPHPHVSILEVICFSINCTPKLPAVVPLLRVLSLVLVHLLNKHAVTREPAF